MPEQNNCWQAGNEILEKSSEIGKLIMRRSAGTWTNANHEGRMVGWHESPDSVVISE